MCIGANRPLDLPPDFTEGGAIWPRGAKLQGFVDDFYEYQ